MRQWLRSWHAALRRPSPRRYKFFARFGHLLAPDRREEMLMQATDFAAHNQVEGEYLEFGVWKGGSLAVAYHAALRRPFLSGMRFFGFDSFEGLPDITGADTGGEFSKGEYAAGIGVVEHALRKSKVDLSRVTLVPGWYDQTLTPALREQLGLSRAAIVYIDCDLYESTVPVLEFITPLLQDGTVLIFDDWFCFKGNPERGEQRACREWQERHGIRLSPYRPFGWPGMSFIVHTHD